MRAGTGSRGVIANWLRVALAAAMLVAACPAAWSGNIRVGFIDPTAPPEFWRPVAAAMQAAAAQLGIDVDIRYTDRSYDKAISVARDFLSESSAPDYLIATNDLGAGGEIIKLADAAGMPVLLLSNDLAQTDWAEFGQPRTRYRHWLGSIAPDHEGAGYGIAEAILTQAARIKTTRPLRLLALTGDAETSASVERVHGLKRAIDVMTTLLGPGSVELVEICYLDWTATAAEAAVRKFASEGSRIDALWAANDPMALGAITALRDNGYKPGVDVLVGGLNWSNEAVERVLNGDMVVTQGGHFLVGAWAMIMLRDLRDGRDFAEEDVRLQFPMGAIDRPIARRFPKIGEIDWRQVDFTRFSKTRNPAVTRYGFTPDAVLGQLSSAQ